MIRLRVAPSPTPYLGSFDLAVFDPSSPSYDPSKEKLPLLLNVPRLVLQGETAFSYDRNGLPTFVVAGTETIIRSERPQTSKQYLVMVTRTFPLAGSGFPESTELAGDDVTMEGSGCGQRPAGSCPARSSPWTASPTS